MNENQERLDLLDRILTKNLAWISAADAKGTQLFAVNSAMLAVMAAITPKAADWTTIAVVFSVFASVALITSICLIVAATFPRLEGPRNSLIYFGGIASHDEDQYVKKIMSGISEELLEDIARQCHRNAEIAKQKYSHVRRSVTATFISLPIWLIAVWQMYPLFSK